MESYERYLNAQMGSAPPKTVGLGGGCSPGSFTIPGVSPSLKPSATLTYTPRAETSWRSPFSRESFADVVRSLKIKMTDYKRGSETVENYLVSVPSGNARPRHETVAQGNKCCYNNGIVPIVDTWTEQGDFSLWSAQYAVHETPPHDSLIPAIAATRDSVVSSFLGGFDLLTEMAQSRETLAYLKSANNDLRDVLSKVLAGASKDRRRRAIRLNPRQLLRSSDRSLRRIGQRWMEYRYALMPLFYTYEDIRTLASEDGSLWVTYRSKREVPVNGGSHPSQDGIWQFNSGSVVVKSTLKARFTHADVSKAQGINFNPLLTAYESVPLSFVLNWIVNVEEFILARSALSLSSDYAACTSVRKYLQVEYRLVVTSPRVFNYTRYGDAACIKAGVYHLHTFERSVDECLQLKTLDTYERSTFGRSDITLRLRGENLSWKRWVDAFALSFNRVGRLWR